MPVRGKEKPNVVEVALKKRHLHLLQKLQQGKPLTPSEIKELRQFEDQQVEPGIVRRQEEVAQVFGVSVRSIQHWVREGMPHTKDGLYSIVNIQAWRDLKKAGKGKSDDIEQWTAEWKKYKAQYAELELKKALGEVIDREEVERGRVTRILIVKKSLLALPQEVAPILANLEPREIQVILEMRIKNIIRRFSGQSETKNDSKEKSK